MGVCKLCLEEKHLIRRSHIIPEFMFRKLYDSKHKFIEVSSALPNKFKTSNVTHKSKGYYESNLFCLGCEEIFQKFETYYTDVFINKKNLEVEQKLIPDHKSNNVGLLISNLDYHKYKLFFLSILFRMSVSKGDFFKQVSIGPYLEPLRKMLLNGTAGSFKDFPFLIFTLKKTKLLDHTVIASPVKLRVLGHTSYVLTVMGMKVQFILSSHLNFNNFKGYFPLENGSHFHYQDGHNLEFSLEKEIYRIVNRIGRPK